MSKAQAMTVPHITFCTCSIFMSSFKLNSETLDMTDPSDYLIEVLTPWHTKVRLIMNLSIGKLMHWANQQSYC